MGSLFWWNFWSVATIFAVTAVVTAVTIWVSRRLRSQRQQEPWTTDRR